MSREKLTREEIAALPVGQMIVDQYGVGWEQTEPGRWWDKSYPADTRLGLAGENARQYFLYSPFKLRE